jgi:tetratricopeptide (TPR) repeat protein
VSVLKVNSKRHCVPAHRGNERLFPLSRSLLAGLLCAGLLWSPAASAAKPSAARQTNEDKGSLAGAYLAGVLAVNLHDTAAAALYSQRLLQLDPRNSEIIERAFIAYLADGDMVQATRLAESMLARDPSNSLTQLVLGVRAFSNKSYDKARSLLKRGGRGRQADVTATLLYAWAQAGSGQYRQAIETVDRLSGEETFAIIRDLHAGLIADLGGLNEEAEKRYRAAYAADHATLRILDALARFLARTGRVDEAVALFDGLDRQSRRNPFIMRALEGLKQGAATPRSVTNVKTGAAESMFGLAMAGGREGDETASLIYLRLALALDPEHDLAVVSLADIYERRKLPEAANKLYDTLPEQAAFSFTGRLQAALNHEQMGEPDTAVAELEKLIASHPDHVEAATSLGNLYRSRKDFQNAAKAYDRAFEAAARSGEPVSWTLYYFRGIAYERTKQWPKAEADFKEALKLQPEQALVLNYLGYSWVDQGLNLDEAFGMLRKAVQQRPRDGYIVDSLGWAYYRLGQYEEAVKLLERAVELRASDPVINDHLGDAYWRIGRKIEAGFQWNHARDLKPDPEDLEVILKKIQNGLSDAPAKIEGPKPDASKPANGG